MRCYNRVTLVIANKPRQCEILVNFHHQLFVSVNGLQGVKKLLRYNHFVITFREFASGSYFADINSIKQNIGNGGIEKLTAISV